MRLPPVPGTKPALRSFSGAGRFSVSAFENVLIPAVKRPLLLSAAAFLALALTSHAQNPSGLPAAPGRSVTNQAPSSRQTAADQAEFLLRNAPAAPLPAGSPRMDTLRARAASLQDQHTRHAQAIATGTTLPDSHLHESRPQHIEQLAALTCSYDQAAAEEDPDQREILSKALFAALQPLGSLLQYADPGQGHLNRISRQQKAELERLERAWIEAQHGHPDEAIPIVALGPGEFFTLTHLSVPLAVKAPPEATVLFHTHGGGLFPNNLPIISVQADENGIARTEWITHGDAIAENTITVRSPQGPAQGEFGITIVQLMLRDLSAAPLPQPMTLRPTP